MLCKIRFSRIIRHRHQEWMFLSLLSGQLSWPLTTLLGSLAERTGESGNQCEGWGWWGPSALQCKTDGAAVQPPGSLLHKKVQYKSLQSRTFYICILGNKWLKVSRSNRFKWTWCKGHVKKTFELTPFLSQDTTLSDVCKNPQGLFKAQQVIPASCRVVAY